MAAKPTCALITGSSSGIGAAFAKTMAADGVNLILVARRKNRLDELQAELKRKYPGINVFVIQGDIRTELSRVEIWQEAITVAERAGLAIDCLINNAGLGHPGWFSRMVWSEIYPMLAVNIAAVTHFANLALTTMVQKKRGWICNVSSVAGFQPGPKMAVYYATKAYVTSLSESLHWEAGRSGVKISTLCPGPVHTEFADLAAMKSSRLFQILPPNTSNRVAETGYRAMLKGRRIQVDSPALSLFAGLSRFLPRRFVLTMIAFLNGAKLKTN